VPREAVEPGGQQLAPFGGSAVLPYVAERGDIGHIDRLCGAGVADCFRRPVTGLPPLAESLSPQRGVADRFLYVGGHVVLKGALGALLGFL
jgi:hypothetical protein